MNLGFLLIGIIGIVLLIGTFVLQKILERMEEKKGGFCHHYYTEDTEFALFIEKIITIIISSFAIIIACASGIKCKCNHQAYLERYAMVQTVIQNGEGIENIAINQTIIELNTWLSDAKASKATLGIFSGYYLMDLDGIEYLTVKK